jgi:O-antigen/teichoic acid export membrane protein
VSGTTPGPGPGGARPPVPADVADGPGRAGAAGVGLASVLAAGSGMVVFVVASKVLDKAENAEFLVFWGLLFFLFGTLGGLQSEVTRATHVARTTGRGAADRTAATAGAERPATTTQPGPRVLPMALVVGAVLAAVVLLTAPLWASRTFGAHPWASVAVVACAVIAFAGHSAMAGSLAGQGSWSVYSRVVCAEALMRLVLVAAVAISAVAPVTLWLRVAAGAAAATWLLMSLAPAVRRAWGERADEGPRAFASASAQAMAGTASSAALVVGFPVLLRATTPTDVFAAAAPLLLAVQLTRAPLLIPLTAYQGMAITYVLRHRERGARPLVRVFALVAAVGAAAAVAAALVGPWLMTLIFGPGYRVDGAVLGGLTLSAVLLALLTLTGAATIALGGHRAYAAGWVLATVVCAAALLLPGELAARVVLSLALGPATGLVVHVAHVRRALKARR